MDKIRDFSVESVLTVQFMSRYFTRDLNSDLDFDK